MNRFKKTNSTKRNLLGLIILVGFSSLFISCSKSVNYPIEPEPVGSGHAKWTESQTPDGWTCVKNEEGATLGYSKNSGLQLIQVDGFAFKDLNRNNLLDKFEDWRLDFEIRANAMVDEIPVEQMMGMKMNPFGGWKVNADSLDTIIKKSLDLGFRQLRAPRGGANDKEQR